MNTGSQNTNTPPFVVVLVVLILAVGGAAIFWSWKNRIYFRFHYKRSDTPLWREERGVADKEDDDTSNTENVSSKSNSTRNNTFIEIQLNS